MEETLFPEMATVQSGEPTTAQNVELSAAERAWRVVPSQETQIPLSYFEKTVSVVANRAQEIAFFAEHNITQYKQRLEIIEHLKNGAPQSVWEEIHPTIREAINAELNALHIEKEERFKDRLARLEHEKERKAKKAAARKGGA